MFGVSRSVVGSRQFSRALSGSRRNRQHRVCLWWRSIQLHSWNIAELSLGALFCFFFVSAEPCSARTDELGSSTLDTAAERRLERAVCRFCLTLSAMLKSLVLWLLSAHFAYTVVSQRIVVAGGWGTSGSTQVALNDVWITEHGPPTATGIWNQVRVKLLHGMLISVL